MSLNDWKADSNDCKCLALQNSCSLNYLQDTCSSLVASRMSLLRPGGHAFALAADRYAANLAR